MKKRILFAVLGLLAVIAILAGVKILQIRTMINQGKSFVPPAEPVTTAAVTSAVWSGDLTAVGTLSAVQGVTVAAELPGKVVKIAFQSGTAVTRGDLLVSQDTSSEEAQLPGLLAQVRLARSELERASRMLAERIVSQADHDRAVATHDQALSQLNGVRTTIAKKSIRAPFGGRIGIRQVNLGQILKEGDAIVTLQNLDPIHVDFSLPQQQLASLRMGQGVRLTCDALGGETVEGRISAITPLVDAETRNVRVQATVRNGGEKLRPGMFVNVAVGLSERRPVRVIPATAVLYAPYGDSVFVVEESRGRTGKQVRQQFVRLGEKRGDLVAVTAGLTGRETVVSTGVFKLRNGQPVVVDNRLAPPFSTSPKPENN